MTSCSKAHQRLCTKTSRTHARTRSCCFMADACHTVTMETNNRGQSGACMLTPLHLDDSAYWHQSTSWQRTHDHPLTHLLLTHSLLTHSPPTHSLTHPPPTHPLINLFIIQTSPLMRPNSFQAFICINHPCMQVLRPATAQRVASFPPRPTTGHCFPITRVGTVMRDDNNNNLAYCCLCTSFPTTKPD